MAEEDEWESMQAIKPPNIDITTMNMDMTQRSVMIWNNK